MNKEKKEIKNDLQEVVTGVNRRSFLKGVTALSAAAVAGGFAANLAAPGTAEAALKKMPTKWDETWDVVVVGSGFAGLAAAAEAAGAGAKTVILEKMPTYGGNSIINGGVYAAWDSKFHYRQNLNLGDDSPAPVSYTHLTLPTIYSV